MELLLELANRIFVKRGNKIKKVFKCPAGFRKGKAVSSLATCFAPRQKASTRIKHSIAARKKSAARVNKTKISNRKAIHFRLKRLNKALRGRR
jgi:hypothetical protein